MLGRAFLWLESQRSSTRMGVILQVGARTLTSLLSLAWTPLLLASLGAPLYGQFLSFQAAATLAGLGDLGMGGAIALRVGRYLGTGDQDRLLGFLANARALFALLAAVMLLGFCLLSPWLPQWLGFKPLPGSGSLTLLFYAGGVWAALAIIASYINNVNHAAMNFNVLTVPLFLLGQGALVGHFICASNRWPLWVQFSSYLLGSLFSLIVSWWYLKRVQPAMGKLLPLQWNPRTTQELLTQSGWMYLAGLGAFVYTTVDRLLINAGFWPALVSVYQVNNKLCELALFVLSNLAFAALPKITLWLSSSLPEDRERVRREARRLNCAQTFVGLSAAFAYLMINDRFIDLWLGPEMQAPLQLQIAFAASLAVTAGSDVGFQFSIRTGGRGLPFAGGLIGITALLNLALSFLAMKMGSFVGIACATVLAQSIMSLVASRYLCNHLSLPWLRWAIQSWGVPISCLFLASIARLFWPMKDAVDVAGLGLLYSALLASAAWCLGITPAALKHEAEIWITMLRRR